MPNAESIVFANSKRRISGCHPFEDGRDWDRVSLRAHEGVSCVRKRPHQSRVGPTHRLDFARPVTRVGGIARRIFGMGIFLHRSQRPRPNPGNSPFCFHIRLKKRGTLIPPLKLRQTGPPLFTLAVDAVQPGVRPMRRRGRTGRGGNDSGVRGPEGKLQDTLVRREPAEAVTAGTVIELLLRTDGAANRQDAASADG